MFFDSAELGPTLSIFAVIINDNGPLSQAELARRSGINRQTAARLLRSAVATRYFRMKQEIVPGLGKVNLWQLN